MIDTGRQPGLAPKHPSAPAANALSVRELSGHGQLQGVELGRAAGAEHVPPGRRDPTSPITAWTWALSPKTQAHALVAVADHLP